jgi:hypothetical protein
VDGEGKQGCEANEARCWWFLGQTFVICFGLAKEKGEVDKEEHIHIEVLHSREIRTDGVEDDGADEFGKRIADREFEDTEGSDESCAALLNDCGHASDVGYSRSKWAGNAVTKKHLLLRIILL